MLSNMNLVRLCKRKITFLTSGLIVLFICSTCIGTLNLWKLKHKAAYSRNAIVHMEADENVEPQKQEVETVEPEVNALWLDWDNQDTLNGNDKDSVDIVYIWVNSSDPKFIHELNTLSRKEHTNPHEILTKNRYDDWGTLKYSLRSVEKFASWARKIHLVTNGQIPNWLQMENRRINIITQKEIFPHWSDLPTCSSAAIECHLHRILGLSKRFLYMRDDVIFTDTVDLSYFYTEKEGYKLRLHKDGLEKCNQLCRVTSVNNGICEQNCTTASCEFDGDDCANVSSLPLYPVADDTTMNDIMEGSLKHTSFIFNKVFGPKERFVPIPGPVMLDRDIAAEMVNRFTDELQTTSSTKIQNNMTFQPMFAYHHYLRAMEDLGKQYIKTTTEWSQPRVRHTELSLRPMEVIINIIQNVSKSEPVMVLSNYFPELIHHAVRNTREYIFRKVLEDMFPSPSKFEVF